MDWQRPCWSRKEWLHTDFSGGRSLIHFPQASGFLTSPLYGTTSTRSGMPWCWLASKQTCVGDVYCFWLGLLPWSVRFHHEKCFWSPPQSSALIKDRFLKQYTNVQLLNSTKGLVLAVCYWYVTDYTVKSWGVESVISAQNIPHIKKDERDRNSQFHIFGTPSTQRDSRPDCTPPPIAPPRR